MLIVSYFKVWCPSDKMWYLKSHAKQLLTKQSKYMYMYHMIFRNYNYIIIYMKNLKASFIHGTADDELGSPVQLFDAQDQMCSEVQKHDDA